jgi:hypothetical protein
MAATTYTGLEAIASALTGAGTFFNSANAYIGVGDNPTAFDPTQTDLVGSNKIRMPMDSGFPVVSGTKITFQATFAPAYANFSWNEWGVFNAATGGIMLARVVEANGSKLANQTWVLTVDVDITAL